MAGGGIGRNIDGMIAAMQKRVDLLLLGVVPSLNDECRYRQDEQQG